MFNVMLAISVGVGFGYPWYITLLMAVVGFIDHAAVFTYRSKIAKAISSIVPPGMRL